MRFDEAFKIMKQGSKVKIPSWGGYWFWSKEKQTIIMHTKDGEEFRIWLDRYRQLSAQL